MNNNNKGFAISTILYGLLSLAIIILMLIFGIMKTNKDYNQELSDSVASSLNNCIKQETDLEACIYHSINGGCVPEWKAYNYCVGNTNTLPEGGTTSSTETTSKSSVDTEPPMTSNSNVNTEMPTTSK